MEVTETVGSARHGPLVIGDRCSQVRIAPTEKTYEQVCRLSQKVAAK